MASAGRLSWINAGSNDAVLTDLLLLADNALFVRQRDAGIEAIDAIFSVFDSRECELSRHVPPAYILAGRSHAK